MKKDFDKTNSLNAAAESSNIKKVAAATSLQSTHNRKAATVNKGKNNKRIKIIQEIKILNGMISLFQRQDWY